MKYAISSRSVKYVALAMGFVGLTVLSPVTISAKKDSNNKITICHATNSEHNPYVMKTIAAEGVINGHLGHDRDIVPPFDYNGTTYSQNWEFWGARIYNNGCAYSTSTDD